ncbi:hypothetical protein HXX76_004945 [Chlamydomonas incerta]|uniref:Uncharacterized protein n=1 Tax=Chlamydomonas incerta TaxID=51695 RepID=A0A835TAN0_CHLIN|nr:hypothetical protein HXX76_004945 [Chlamydomonas incerta]|eukprot:KAG2439593.1 hypothetical protein HXX76_004945 [Chlamydomonas incerta]
MAELEALLAASQARQAAERAAAEARAAAAARPESPPDAFVSTHFVSVEPMQIPDTDSDEDEEPVQARSKAPMAAASPTAKRRSSVVTFDGASLAGSGSVLAAGPQPPGMARAPSFSRSRSYRDRDSGTNVNIVGGTPNAVLAAAMFTAAATGGGGGGSATFVAGSGRSFTGHGGAPLASPEATGSGMATGAPMLGRAPSMRRGSVTEVGAVGVLPPPPPPPLMSSTSMRRRSSVEPGIGQGQQLQHTTSSSAAIARVTSGGFEGVLGVANNGGSFGHGGVAQAAAGGAALRASSDRTAGGGGRFMQMLKGMFSGGDSSSRDGAEPASAPQQHIAAAAGGAMHQSALGGVNRQRADSVSFSAARSGLSFVGRSAQSVTSVPSMTGMTAHRAPSSSQQAFTAAAASAGIAAVGGSGMSFSGQQQYVGGVVGSGPSFSGGGRGHALVPTASNNGRRASSTTISAGSFRAPSNSQIPHVVQAQEGAGGSLPVLSRARSVNTAAAVATLSALAR